MARLVLQLLVALVLCRLAVGKPPKALLGKGGAAAGSSAEASTKQPRALAGGGGGGGACEYGADVDGDCFGSAAFRQKWFLLDPTYRSFNHGSYGTVPRPVAAVQQSYYLECEAAPDKWLRTNYFPKIEDARKAIATKVVNSDPNSIVLVENASAAVNSILRSVTLKKGDKVLRLSTAYGMVINTLKFLQDTVGIEVVVVGVEFPVTSPRQILDAVKAALDANPGVVLSIFSHISSVPAVVEPVEELQAMARSVGSLVLIDGAHAPGAIPIDLTKLAPDFYLGNAHKWLFSPKGTAFLYVSPALVTAHSPEPSVINLDPTQPAIADRFKYTGTKDYTGQVSIPAGISFFEDSLGGMSKVMAANHQLAIDAGNLLCQRWKTTWLVPPSMTGAMANIVLPWTDPAAVSYVASALLSEYNSMVVFASVLPTQGASSSAAIQFIRLSAQVYVSMDDVRWLADTVPVLFEQYAAVVAAAAAAAEGSEINVPVPASASAAAAAIP